MQKPLTTILRYESSAIAVCGPRIEGSYDKAMRRIEILRAGRIISEEDYDSFASVIHQRREEFKRHKDWIETFPDFLADFTGACSLSASLSAHNCKPSCP